jgi:hypothetical protein
MENHSIQMTEMWHQLMTVKEFIKVITYGKGLSPTAKIIREEFNAVKFRQNKRIADLNKAFNQMNIFQNTIKSYIDDDDLLIVNLRHTQYIKKIDSKNK